MGQVGRAADAEGRSAFCVHAQRGAVFGDARALAEAFLKAGDSKVGNGKAMLPLKFLACAERTLLTRDRL